MNTAAILLNQILIMFLFMAIGWILFKTGLITKEGSRSMANLLLYVVVPCVIVKSFCSDSTAQLSQVVLYSILGAVIVLGLSILISHLIFHNHPMNDFGAAFSNAGFMGLPLITAALGEEAVIYVAAMIAILNILQWTYGQAILSGDHSNLSIRKVLINPLVIAFVLGLVIFFLRIPVPDLVYSCMESVAAMNAPAAMIVLGVYLAQVRLRDIVTDPQVWCCSLVRLLLIPAVTVIVLALAFPQQREMALALAIASAAPIGANLAVYAQKLGKDYGYAVKAVCLSTLLSIGSMPLMMILWDVIVG